jgi:hypothetical protein
MSLTDPKPPGATGRYVQAELAILRVTPQER